MGPDDKRNMVVACSGAMIASLTLASMLFLVDQAPRLDELALGSATVSTRAKFGESTIGAFRVENYHKVYPPKRVEEHKPVGLWLGNSQLHAINEGYDAENTAAGFASEELGYPIVALSLPNACLEEHLLVLAWALERKTPNVVVLPLVYDDLREVGLRPDLEALASELVDASVRRAQLGSLIEEFGPESDSLGSVSPAIESSVPLLSKSAQPVVEGWLDDIAAAWISPWAKRDQMWGQVRVWLIQLRNTVFGINASSVRRMIPNRQRRNMSALSRIISLCESEGVELLVYIAPLRWSPSPPYDLASYREWKKGVVDLTPDHPRLRVMDLDQLVPDGEWGDYSNGRDGEIDFMHFRVRGHELLGAMIAEQIGAFADRK